MRRLFIVGQTVAVAPVVWLSATGTEKVVVFLFGCATGAVIVGLTVAWLSLEGTKRKPFWPPFTTAMFALAVVATVIVTAWPLRLSFVLSRPSLERLALAVHEGRRLAAPVRVGLFVVNQAEMSPRGVVCLWTGLAPSGRTGFVQSNANFMPLNLWSSIQLDEQWHLVAED